MSQAQIFLSGGGGDWVKAKMKWILGYSPGESINEDWKYLMGSGQEV